MHRPLRVVARRAGSRPSAIRSGLLFPRVFPIAGVIPPGFKLLIQLAGPGRNTMAPSTKAGRLPPGLTRGGGAPPAQPPPPSAPFG